jgi:hypothetical protein
VESPAVYELRGYLEIAGNTLKLVGFEVLTVMVLKSSIFWDITPCRI